MSVLFDSDPIIRNERTKNFHETDDTSEGTKSDEIKRVEKEKPENEKNNRNFYKNKPYLF